MTTFIGYAVIVAFIAGLAWYFVDLYRRKHTTSGSGSGQDSGGGRKER